MRQPIGDRAVIGHEQETRAIDVQSPHRIEPRMGRMLHKIHRQRAPLWIAVGADIALGLEEHVYLTGILHEIAPLLNASTLAVLPSLVEPLGMFQIEAQYLGVPTIASRVGGIPETILHEETGLMVEPGKVRAWADAICWVLQHPTEAKQMAERGKAFVTAKFSMERNTVELIKLMQA